MEDKTPTKVPKSTPKILTKFFLYSEYRMPNITGKIIQFSAVAKKGHFHNMTENEKEVVEIPVMCHPVAWDFT